MGPIQSWAEHIKGVSMKDETKDLITDILGGIMLFFSPWLFFGLAALIGG